MNRPMAVAATAGALCGAGTLALVLYAALGALEASCEVCVTFRGGTVCREAAGASRPEAIRTATDNACAFLASGMTETVQCTSAPPTSTSCVDL